MDLSVSMERLCLRQNLPGLQASKDTYNKLFFLNTHSIDATVQVYADADRSSKGATQFINHLQCRICEKVFHKAFGLEFHLNHEHDANEKPKKKFDVKTFISKTSSARHKKAKSKKSKKKSNKKDWDLENAWRDDDSDETDGEVVYDDESDLDVLEPDDDLDDDIEVVESSPAGKKKSGPPKTIIDTFDAETAAVLSGFKELQPTVYIRDIRDFPDAAGGIELPPLEEAVQSAPTCDGKNDDTTSVVSFDSEPADPSTILDGLEDCGDMWEEPDETEEERALMQQLEDVIARPTSAPVKVAASKEEVTRDITVKVVDERGTRDVAAEVTHKVTPQKGDTKQAEDIVTSVTKSHQGSVVTPLKVTRDSHGGSYKVSKDKSKGDEGDGKVKRAADSENDVVNVDTPSPKKYKPSPASKKKTSKLSSEDVVDILDTTFDQLTPATSENKNENSEDVVEVVDTTLDQPCSDKAKLPLKSCASPPSKVPEEVVDVMDTTVDIEVDDQPTENVSPAVEDDTDSKAVNTGEKKAEAIPFVCCKFVTVESTDDEADEAVDVVNVDDTTPSKISPVKNSKPAASPAQPPKKKSPSIKHIALTKKKIEELKSTEPPLLNIKKDIGSPPAAVSKRRSKAPPVAKDDSDSDIEIIMSPTAPKKKTAAAAAFVPTTKEEQKLVQIRQMIQRQSAAIETEKKLRRSQFIGDDDLDSSDELNGPNAWSQPSPRKKQKCQRPAAAVVKEQSLGTPSHYSSSGTVSPMEMGTPLKPLGLDAAEKQLVAKRRLFTNTPTKVQPKKARNATTTFRPTPDDDDDLICLD